MKTLMVIGSGGYIGNELVKFVAPSFSVIEFDISIDPAMNICNFDSLLSFMKTHPQIDVIVLLAAETIIPNAIKDPENCYNINVTGSLNVLKAARICGVKNIVFASSGSVYGMAKECIESITPQPINPYSFSKVVVERILSDFHKAFGLKSITLRLFNPVGGCENHNPETHLVPLARGTQTLAVFGNDHSTEDGTCVRDYVHMSDVVRAFKLAIKKLLSVENICEIYNVGTGKGYSVMEVLRIIRGGRKEMNILIKPRREGDASITVSNAEKIKSELGWEAEIKNPQYLFAPGETTD